MKKHIISYLIMPAAVMLLCGCTKTYTIQAEEKTHDKTEITIDESNDSSDTDADNTGSFKDKLSEMEETQTEADANVTTGTDSNTPADEEEEESMKDPELLYMGHASLRIVTGENKVIYIDPFCGDGYDKAADMILQTHDHYDHKDLSKISRRNDDCIVITQNEALAGGTHQSFETDYVRVEAVEAGYNQNHNVNSCVGYILTFNNDVTLYISGDTSTTQQMPELAERELDYAFYCCDGVYNMDVAEASECAKMVGAKVNIPYHSGPANKTLFDMNNAKNFDAPGTTLLIPGNKLVLEKP